MHEGHYSPLVESGIKAALVWAATRPLVAISSRHTIAGSQSNDGILSRLNV